MAFWVLVIGVVLVLPVAVVVAVVALGRLIEPSGDHKAEAGSRGRNSSIVRALSIAALAAWAFVSLITVVGIVPVVLSGIALAVFAAASGRGSSQSEQGEREARRRRTTFLCCDLAVLILAALLLLVTSALGIVPGWSAVGVTLLGLWLAAPLIGLALAGFGWSRRGVVNRSVGALCVGSLLLVVTAGLLASFDVPLRVEVGLRRNSMDVEAQQLLATFASGKSSYNESIEFVGGFAVRGAYGVSCIDGGAGSLQGVHYWLNNSSSYLTYCPSGEPSSSRGQEENVHLLGNWWVVYPALID